MPRKDSNRVFIKACKKAGLDVEPEASRRIKRGLIICDAKGQSYTVDVKGQLKSCTPQIRVDSRRTVSAVPSSMKVARIAGRKKAGHIIASKSNHPIKRRLKSQG